MSLPFDVELLNAAFAPDRADAFDLEEWVDLGLGLVTSWGMMTMIFLGGLPMALSRHCAQTTSVAGHFLGRKGK